MPHLSNVALVRYRNNPGLAGRETERGVLASAIEGAASGSASTVMVHGPAGIGKTALVDAAIRDMLDADTLVLRGVCLPFLSVKVPFLGLRSMYRGYGDDAPRGAFPPPDFDQAPARVPMLLDQWVSTISRERTLVIAIDDMHWADEETLDAMLYLMSGPANRRLALIGTTRTDEARAATRKPAWIDQLRRSRRARVLELGPLDRIATADQITSIMGGAPAQSLIEEIYQRTRGHPYLTELTIAGIGPDSLHLPRNLPDTVTAAVLESVHVLSPDAQRLAGVLAVAHRPLSATDLRALLSAGHDAMSPTAVAELLDDAVRNGVLIDQGRGTLWFRHPLTAELVEAELGDEERHAWHRVVGRQIETEEGSRPTSLKVALEIADHWYLGGAMDAAFQAADRAAQLARLAHAYPQELKLLLRMLDLTRTTDSGRERGRLLRDARLAAERAGALDDETAIVEELLHEDLADLEWAALSLRRVWLRAITQTESLPRGACEEVLVVTSRHPSGWEHAIALSSWAATGLDARFVEPRFAEGAKTALEAARASNSAAAIAIAAEILAEFEANQGNREGAARSVAEATKAAIEAQDWVIFNSASHLAAFLHPDASTRGIAVRLSERREMMIAGNAPHVYSAWLAASEASFWLESGDWRASLTALRFVAARNPGRYSDASSRITWARLAALQGRPEEAQANIARVQELIAAHPALVLLPVDAVLAETRLSMGDTQGAWTAAHDGLTRPTLPEMGEWLAPLAARALADMAESLRDRGGDPGPPLNRLDDLLRQYPRVAMPEIVGLPPSQRRKQAFEELYESEIARCRRSSSAYQRWLSAADACAAAELPWEEAYAMVRAAECFIRHAQGMRDRGALRDVVQRGTKLATRLGAAPLIAKLDRIASLARMSSGSAPHAATAVSRSPAPAPNPRLDALTEREREVLGHIATGQTYLEIAADLHISEKTVSAHVSHLLTKTGASNRMELSRLTDAAASTRPVTLGGHDSYGPP